jgi:hypothetical protein
MVPLTRPDCADATGLKRTEGMKRTARRIDLQEKRRAHFELTPYLQLFGKPMYFI